MSPSRHDQFDEVRSEPDKLASLIESAIAEGAAGEAVEWSEHLSRIDPNRVRRYLLHARTLGAAGQFSKAESVVTRYEQLFAEDSESLTARGEIALLRQLGAKAESFFLDALRRDPSHKRAAQLLLVAARGDAKREAELLTQAAGGGSRRAALELASRLLAELRYDEAAEHFAAVIAASQEPDVLEEVSYLLVRARLHDRAVSLVQPHLDAEDVPAAVNVLNALITLQRFDDAAALLERFAPAADAKIAFYRELVTRHRQPLKSSSPSQLLEVLAACSRMDTPRTRQRFYRKLMMAELVLAVELPLSREPNEHTEPLRGLIPVERTTATLARTLLAFTHREALRAWNSGAASLSLPARELFVYASTRGDVAVVINAAGPSSAELYQAELTALANEQLPAIGEEEIASREAFYIFEPMTAPPPETLVQRLRNDLAEYPEITEAYLVQIVNERLSCAWAVAVVFSATTRVAARRDLLFDLIDPSLHAERERRVHFFEVDERLLPEVRRGFWLIEDIA